MIIDQTIFGQKNHAVTVFMQQGRTAYKNRNYRTAIAFFDQAIASSNLNQSFFQGYLWKAKSYYKLGNYRLARVNSDIVLSAIPNHTAALALKKLVCAELKDYSAAKAIDQLLLQIQDVLAQRRDFEQRTLN